METLVRLFISFFKIGAFSFGGGYAMLPIIKEETINTYGWLTNEEFIDIVAISEITPGPIAINSGTFLGYRLSGIVGAIVATVAVILPSFIIMSIIFRFMEKFKDSPYMDWFFIGIRPVVLGLIAAAAITVAGDSFIDLKSVLIGVAALLLITIKKLNPIHVLILAGISGVILY